MPEFSKGLIAGLLLAAMFILIAIALFGAYNHMIEQMEDFCEERHLQFEGYDGSPTQIHCRYNNEYFTFQVIIKEGEYHKLTLVP